MLVTKQLDWITDPHLDHLKGEKMLLSFVKKLAARESDGLLITGDIAESKTIYDFLGILSGCYRRPIYFVLGNHDHYGAWMKDTHDRVRAVCEAVPPGILNWMTETGVVMLNDRTAVVGHEGWYDGQAGEAGLTFSLSDFYMPNGVLDLIQAFGLGSHQLFDKLRQLGIESADHIRSSIIKARNMGAKRILIITHVPPFLEASYFRGRPSEANSAPFYVNRVLGETLMEVAQELPKVKLEVYAGHTHGKRVYEAARNLTVRVGAARYGRLPTFQTPIKF
jgi:predicted phosphodiesterase